MIFTTLVVVATLGLWGLGYYPIHHYLGEEHWKGFLFASSLNTASVLISYYAFQIVHRKSPEKVVYGILAGPMIRMGLVIAGLATALILPHFDAPIVALWTLALYFIYLTSEVLFLTKEISESSEAQENR